jgi:hypothetical protein
MKHINRIIALFISTFLITPASLAYVSGKKPTNETHVYCPSQITCSEASNLKSCKFDGVDPIYWDHMWVNDKADVIAGAYKFRHASSTYHSNSGTGVICSYKNSSSGEKNIALYAEYQTNLEAAYSSTTSWILKYYPSLTTADCRADTPTLCPLHEQSSFAIINNKILWHVFPSINGNQINTLIVRYEDALAKCQSEKLCKVDIMAIESGKDPRTYIEIGSVTVDMDNKLKITQIYSYKSSGYKIKQIDPFNSIEVKKTDTEPSIISIRINNYISSEILASTNDIPMIDKPIAAGNHNSIFSDRALASCRSSKECKIDFKTLQGAYLGSMIVDIENKMKILQIIQTHPAEISIRQAFPNVVEIIYPNKI